MSRKKYKFDKVILVIADTLRAKNVGLYGAKPSPTPNIDKFGSEGVVFLNAYTTITATDPSISSTMSGLYPLRLGLINHGFHISSEEEKALDNAIFLSEIFQKNGYRTAAIDWLGRWHKRGFDYYSGRLKTGKGKTYPIFDKLPFPLILRILDKIAVKFLKREIFIRFYYAFFPNPQIPYDSANLIIDEAIKILKKNKKNKLFLYMHLWDAHSPHTKPRGLKSYLKDNIEATYNAEVNFIDKEMGRFIRFLKETNSYDNSLIIFMADHGENLHEHDIPFNHENLYEDVLRVPLIFMSKTLNPKKIKSQVQLIDNYPTILDFCGIGYDTKKIDGKSLIPLLIKDKPLRETSFFEDLTYRKINFPANTRRRGIRKGNYKFIETLSGNRKYLYSLMPNRGRLNCNYEMFDLGKDPDEKDNLVIKKSGLAEDLKRELDVIISRLNDKRLDFYKKSKKEKLKGNMAEIKEDRDIVLENLRSVGY